VALGRKPILVGPRDPALVRNVLGRVAHRAILEGAPQAVADQGIDQLAVAVLETGAGPLDQVRGPAHALHPARGDDLGVSSLDRLSRKHDRLEPGPAHLVDGVRGDRVRQPREQGCLPGRVLADAGLDHVAHDHLIDLFGPDAGPLEGLGECDRPEPRGGDVGQFAEELADRGAGGGEEEDVHRVGPERGAGSCCILPDHWNPSAPASR
jgi:hypothetical protein